MKKSDLKHNMIVRSSGGRYGVVVLKDATCENVIKFFYDPLVLVNYGYLQRDIYFTGVIVPLADFDDDLVVRSWHEEEGERVAYWNIEEVFELNSVFKRKDH